MLYVYAGGGGNLYLDPGLGVRATLSSLDGVCVEIGHGIRQLGEEAALGRWVGSGQACFRDSLVSLFLTRNGFISLFVFLSSMKGSYARPV
jgi:hypothetical protein